MNWNWGGAVVPPLSYVIEPDHDVVTASMRNTPGDAGGAVADHDVVTASMRNTPMGDRTPSRSPTG